MDAVCATEGQAVSSKQKLRGRPVPAFMIGYIHSYDSIMKSSNCKFDLRKSALRKSGIVMSAS